VTFVLAGVPISTWLLVFLCRYITSRLYTQNTKYNILESRGL
jgi:hypothetical protein